jgi:hypothetical protein
MTLIECPSCRSKVDIDRPDVMKWEDGTDLIVRCASCRERFVLERAALARVKLRRATHGWRSEGGQEQRIQLPGG